MKSTVRPFRSNRLAGVVSSEPSSTRIWLSGVVDTPPDRVDGAEFAGRFFRLSAELRRARLGEERRARAERARRHREVEEDKGFDAVLLC